MKKIVLLLLCMASVWAERSGPYLGVGYGIGEYEDDGYNGAGGYTTSVNAHPRVWRVCGGAYMNENFSVELDYINFDAQELKNGLNERVKNGFTTLSVSALAHYPAYDDHIDFFAKFGAGEIKWEQTGAKKQADEAGLLLFGAGAGYRLSENMMIKIGYDLITFGLKTTLHEYSMRHELFYAGFEVQF